MTGADLIVVDVKWLSDQSMPGTVITVYNESPGVDVSKYKTQVAPLALGPGVSQVGGLDVRIVDPVGNTRPQWIDDYNTAINGLVVWQKIQVNDGMPSQSIVLVDNVGNDVNGGLGGPLSSAYFTAIDGSDELHKVVVTDLPKNVPVVVEG